MMARAPTSAGEERLHNRRATEFLRARHEAQGLRLHPRTACPLRLGERLDLGWAIDVLHPLATRAQPRSAHAP